MQLTPPASEGSAPEDATPTNAALERAALRVANQLERASTAFADGQSARLVLAELVRRVQAVADGRSVASLGPLKWSADAIRWLALLRRELLGGGVRSDHSAEDSLQLLTAIELLAQACEGDASVRFSSQLAGEHSPQLLAEVAHDMQSPLSAILFLVERLQRSATGRLSAAQERHLALVYSAAFGLSTLTSDVMELARGGARLLDEAPRAFSIGETLRSVRDLVQPLAEEKRVAVRFSGPMTDKRIGQPAAISRVLLNLTTNAIKFTTIGSVTVLVESQSDAPELSFMVEDTGRGIPREELAQIFDAFRPDERRGEHRFSSAGLGLAICHKLVSAMGGALTVESQVNHGTRFNFTLSLPPA